MKDEEKREPVRFMTMGELALRYFNSSSMEGARKRLTRVLTRRNLWDKMRQCGYKDDPRNIPPRVIRMLDDEFLGPGEAYI